MKKTVLFLGLLAILCAGCKPDVSSCFTATPSQGSVSFSSACAIEAATFEWDFGDGSTSTNANPTHFYTNSGTYTVSLRVEDKKGNGSSYSSAVTVTSCPVCVNGTCVNFACQCDGGYEGIDCSTGINEKFVGNYSLVETCTSSGSTGPYTVTIVAHPSSSGIADMRGLWEVNDYPVSAVIETNGTQFTIPLQAISNNFYLECNNGTITADGHTINMTYTIYPSGSNVAVETCTATLTR